MFHYFKIPYFTCIFFTKFTYNEYIGPYFLSHVVLRFSPIDLPGMGTPKENMTTSKFDNLLQIQNPPSSKVLIILA
jgi:hypothetical protein